MCWTVYLALNVFSHLNIIKSIHDHYYFLKRKEDDIELLMGSVIFVQLSTKGNCRCTWRA